MRQALCWTMGVEPWRTDLETRHSCTGEATGAPPQGWQERAGSSKKASRGGDSRARYSHGTIHQVEKYGNCISEKGNVQIDEDVLQKTDLIN